MDRKQEFERSNAFVDDELDRKARGEVLAGAARDPRLAKELSDLNRLKSMVEDSVDVPHMELPAPPAGRGRRYRAAMAMAAGLALLVLGGLGWWFMPSPAPSHGVPVAWAIDAHGSWRDAGAEARAMPRPANARLDAHVPDLSAAKLRVAHIGELKTPDGMPALVVGYLGTRGCRVTLLVDPAPTGLGEKAIKFRVDRLYGMVWRAGNLRHVILAEGMAQGRFRLIAETVRRSSLERPARR